MNGWKFAKFANLKTRKNLVLYGIYEAGVGASVSKSSYSIYKLMLIFTADCLYYITQVVAVLHHIEVA